MRENYIVFGKPGCSYCTRAVKELEKRNLEFAYIDVSIPSNLEVLKLRLPSVRTVPQIWLAEAHVGGYDQLMESFE